MATIKFYCRTNDKEKLAPVYVRYTDSNGVNLISRTEYKMVPKHWDPKKGEFKKGVLDTGVFKLKDKKDIEDKFAGLKDFILRDSFNVSGPITLQWLKDTLEKYKNIDKGGEETLKAFIKRYIKEAKGGQRMATTHDSVKRYSKETIRSFSGLLTAFEMFCTDSKREYNFNEINLQFYDRFIQFFYERECSPNYVGRLLKTLKTIMRVAFDEGLHVNQEYEKRSFRAISAKTEKIFLTPAEVKKLLALDLKDNPHWDRVRDIFLVGCYTAQRFSDFSTINKSNIIEEGGRKYIKIRHQNKTGADCVIPVSGDLDSILKKYNYNLPKSYQQKVNVAIKKIAEKAEINDVVYIDEHKGSKIESNKYLKHELISTHCCRRTGITNMVAAKIPLHKIMLISGHATEREFMKYVRTSKMENAKELSRLKYFSPLTAVK